MILKRTRSQKKPKGLSFHFSAHSANFEQRRYLRGRQKVSGSPHSGSRSAAPEGDKVLLSGSTPRSWHTAGTPPADPPPARNLPKEVGRWDGRRTAWGTHSLHQTHGAHSPTEPPGWSRGAQGDQEAESSEQRRGEAQGCRHSWGHTGGMGERHRGLSCPRSPSSCHTSPRAVPPVSCQLTQTPHLTEWHTHLHQRPSRVLQHDACSPLTRAGIPPHPWFTESRPLRVFTSFVLRGPLPTDTTPQ